MLTSKGKWLFAFIALDCVVYKAFTAMTSSQLVALAIWIAAVSIMFFVCYKINEKMNFKSSKVLAEPYIFGVGAACIVLSWTGL